jgi:hypothetical protein
MKLKPILDEIDGDVAKLKKDRAGLDEDIQLLLQARHGLVENYGGGNRRWELTEDPGEPSLERTATLRCGEARRRGSAALPAKRKYKKRQEKNDGHLTPALNPPAVRDGEGDEELLAVARKAVEPFTAGALAVAAGKSDKPGKKLLSNRCNKWRKCGWLERGDGGFVRSKTFPPGN